MDKALLTAEEQAELQQLVNRCFHGEMLYDDDPLRAHHELEQRGPILVSRLRAALAQAQAEWEALLRDAAKATAYRIVLEARSWGAALGAIAEMEPDVVRVIDEHDAYVKSQVAEREARWIAAKIEAEIEQMVLRIQPGSSEQEHYRGLVLSVIRERIAELEKPAPLPSRDTQEENS